MIHYPGRTEILADYGGTERVAMMLANDDIRTVLATIHTSLRNAIEQADFAAQMSAIRHAHKGGKALGIAALRVAAAGLNPTQAKAASFGNEELPIIKPAIEAARAQGIDASGPRTSPDHSTAFDIAGRRLADPASLETAIACAPRLVAAQARTYILERVF